MLYEMMSRRYGGRAEVRDLAVLDAVVARPKERYAAGLTGLAELATCYAAGVILNRPFASGNLAIGLLIAATFLGAHGLFFRGKELYLVSSVLDLMRGDETEAEFARYLRCNFRAD